MTLTREGAGLASVGLVAAILGAVLSAPLLMLFGGTLLFYLAWSSLGLSAVGAALQSDKVRVTRRFEGTRTGGSLLLGRATTVELAVENRLPLGLARVTLNDVLPRSMREVAPEEVGVELGPGSRAVRRYDTVADVVGPACFGGLRVTVADSLGLLRQERFFALVDTVQVLPLSRGLGGVLSRVGQARQIGRQRMTQKGLGSDLHEIRSYVTGDSLRKIAWKAVARTGRVLTKETEAELTVPLVLLVDVSSGMRAGRFGRTKLDFVIQAAATLAAASSWAHDPCGLGIFSERHTSYIPPALGRHHFVRVLGSLGAARERPVAEQLPRARLSLFIQGYLHGLDRASCDPPTDLWQPAVVYDWIAREYSLTLAERQNMDTDSEFGLGWMIRFCRDRGLAIPPVRGEAPGHRSPAEATIGGRDERLLRLVEQALIRTKDRQLFVVFSDFEGVEASPVLLKAFRLARSRHHGVLLVSPFTPWFEVAAGRGDDPAQTTAAEAAEEMYTLTFMEERKALRQAVRRLGIPVRDLTPQRMVVEVLEEVARMKRDRAVKR